MSKRSARYLLEDMLDAIDAITSFTAGYTFEQFVSELLPSIYPNYIHQLLRF